jgi:hypothetical protein
MNQHEMQGGVSNLLAIFNGLIANYGGAEKLVNAIEAEWTKTQIGNKIDFWSKAEEIWLSENYLSMPYETLAKKLGRTNCAVTHKLSRMYYMGMVKKMPQMTR